ncbi:hypothetical protein PLUTE_a4244 [Pseudoalteromonas luteoviolacea DSM 6061]|nr:hypothetical protein [Pseudoalteromonas luteoviolacea DSM 6061]
MMTLLIYLNDNYDGGRTTFRQDNIEGCLKQVKPFYLNIIYGIKVQKYTLGANTYLELMSFLKHKN